MNDMRIEVEIGREPGDIEPLAMQLMDSAFKFYEDPENEKAFQEWKKERAEILRCAQNDEKERSA